MNRREMNEKCCNKLVIRLSNLTDSIKLTPSHGRVYTAVWSAARSRTSRLGDNRSELKEAKKEVDLRRWGPVEWQRWSVQLGAPSIPKRWQSSQNTKYKSDPQQKRITQRKPNHKQIWRQVAFTSTIISENYKRLHQIRPKSETKNLVPKDAWSNCVPVW